MKAEEMIIRQGGEYVLALKGNQNLTHDEITTYLDWLESKGEWASLRSAYAIDRCK